MKARKIGATLLAAVLAGSLLAGCGGESESTSNTGSVSNSGSTSESSTSDTSESSTSTSEGSDSTSASSNTDLIANIPEVPDLGGMTSLEWLLAQEDNTRSAASLPITLKIVPTSTKRWTRSILTKKKLLSH